MRTKAAENLDTIFNLFYSIHHNILELEQKLIIKNNLSSSAYGLLNLCSENFTYSCKDVSQMVGLSLSRTSRILDKMVKKQLIIRKCDPNDRRKCEIFLTKEGMKIKSKILKQRNEMKNRLTVNYKNTDLRRLILNLREIKDISSSFYPDS